MFSRVASEKVEEVSVSSSLRLQLQLSTNALFYIAFAIVLMHGSANTSRAWYFRLATAALILFEPVRLYFGFKGNLSEKIPALLMFMALSLFPSTSLCIVFLAADPELTKGEWTVLIFQVIFSLLQCATAMYVTKLMMKIQADSLKNRQKISHIKNEASSHFGANGARMRLGA